MENVVAQLEAKVDRLSAQTRRQQRWLIALSVVIVAVVLVAARDPDRDVVRARRFEAIDEKGRVVAVLASSWTWGKPALALLDEDGEAFAFLTKTDVAREPGSAEKSSAVILQMEADAAVGDESGVASLVVTGVASALNLSNSDDEAVSLGAASDRIWMAMTRHFGRDDDPKQESSLFELTVKADVPVLEMHDGAGESLLRVP